MTFQLFTYIFSHVLYFLFVFLMQPFEHFNVIALYKLNIIIIILLLVLYLCAVCEQLFTILQ